MIAAMSASATLTAFTHRGRVRARNEDTIAIGDWVSPPDMDAPRVVRHDLATPILCAVCDGMGGHRGGAVASRLAAQRLAQLQARIVDARTAAAALCDIDLELYRRMAEDDTLLGMGTTAVGLMLAARAVWFNVGDSRLYRRSGPHLRQISVDDTPPGPRSGVITQSLGGALRQPGIVPHAGEEPLDGAASYLLCSDGLTDMLDDAAIAECLAPADAKAAMRLFERAMDAGGYDNISIVLARLEPRADAAAA
jgi:serine/threonine protein phosphatase PrpC